MKRVVGAGLVASVAVTVAVALLRPGGDSLPAPGGRGGAAGEPSPGTGPAGAPAPPPAPPPGPAPVAPPAPGAPSPPNAPPPPAPALSGVVRDVATGEPIAGARVALRPRAGGDVQGTRADAAGRFAFGAVPPGPLEVVGIAPGWLVPDPLVVSPGTPAVDLGLERGLVVRGRVAVVEGGLPARALLRLVGPRPDRFLGEPVLAAPDGTFEVAGVPPGAGYDVVAEADGYAEARAAVPEVRAPLGADGVVVVLRRLVVRGTIEPDGVALAPDLCVEARGEGEDAVAARPASGRFEVALPRGGVWSLRARQAGAASAWVRVVVDPDGPPPEVALRLAPLSRVEGRVVERGGRAVEGATVLLRPASPQEPGDLQVARAGGDGAFSFRTGPGRYEVVAASPVHASRRAAVEAGAAPLVLVLEPVPEPVAVQAGPFLGRDGRPLAGALSLEYATPGEPALDVALDADGRPGLTALGPGRWTISFPEACPDELRAWVRELEVAPGAPARLAHAEAAPRGRLEGIVRGAPREGLVQVEVHPAAPPREAFGFLAARAAQGDGRFAFAEVPPGSYAVLASWDGGAARGEVEVRPAATAYVEVREE